MADSFCIGLDLCADSAVISYFNDINREPETIGQLNNKDSQMMPNILFYSKDAEDWYVGSEASEARFKEQGIIIDNLYENAGNEQLINVYDRAYTYRELFLKMIKMHLDSFLYRYEGGVARKLVITIPEYDKTMFRVLSGLYQEINVPKEDVIITSHIDSGLYFVMNQDRDVWSNSVGIFDFGPRGLIYYRVDISRQKIPATISVKYKDLSDKLTLTKFGKDEIALDEAFAEIATEEMRETFISTVFLTGIGFSGEWMRKSNNILCEGRKVFLGQNLYSHGACYRAFGGEYTKFYTQYYVENLENVMFDIGVSSGPDGADDFIPISRGGMQWYNTKGRIEVILDDTDELEFIYKNIKSEQEIRETVKLHGIPKRPNKTSKFSIEVNFGSQNKGAIVIKDVGFGKLFPTTNKIYRKEFEL